MEKRGVIDENTPSEVTDKPVCRDGRCGCKRQLINNEKQAADQREDHAATRAASAVRDAIKR